MTAHEFIDSQEWTQSTVHFSIGDVVDLMQEYARIKCLAAIRNTRYAAIDICLNYHESDNSVSDVLGTIEKEIHNISNQDVMPKL